MNRRSLAVVLGVLAVTMAAPFAGGQSQPGAEEDSFFRVDAGTTSSPTDVGDGLRVCATHETFDGRMGWTWVNQPADTTQIPREVNDSIVLEQDSEGCVQPTSCEAGTIDGVTFDEKCDTAQNTSFNPDVNPQFYDALADCFCLNTTGRLSVFYRINDTTLVDGDWAWMNLTVRENQALYDAWRTNDTQAENTTTNTTIGFESGGLPFFSNLDVFAEPLFWIGMAVILYVNGWLISGTYFIVGYMGNFLAEGASWLADDLLLGLAGLFLLLEFSLNYFARRIKRALKILRGRPVQTVEPSEEERV